MIRLPLLLLTAALWTAPAMAQHMPGMAMPGMVMPPPAKASTGKQTPAKKPAAAPRAATVADPSCPPEHAAMGHCTPAVPPAAAPEPVPMPAPITAAGTALPAGNAPAPAPPAGRAADRFYPAAAMARASAAMHREHGGMAFSQILFNLAEVQARRGRNGYRWDGEGWYGGDIHRLVVKSEGEAAFGRHPDDADVQLLYSRAIDPYFDFQAGVRRTVGIGPDRTWATLGVEGLAPYWFDVEAAAFLSDKGDLLARVEACTTSA